MLSHRCGIYFYWIVSVLFTLKYWLIKSVLILKDVLVALVNLKYIHAI